jgi:hypothetical protein
MILLLVEMMNQSLGTCPKFGVHFKKQPTFHPFHQKKPTKLPT